MSVDNNLVSSLQQDRRRKRELKRELQRLKTEIAQKESKAREMLTREGQLLDAFDEAERLGNGSSVVLPVDESLVAEFTGVDEGNWDAFLDASLLCAGLGPDPGSGVFDGIVSPFEDSRSS